MIKIIVDDLKCRAYLKRMAAEHPREMSRAVAIEARNVKSKMAKAVKKPSVPMSTIHNILYGRKSGGVLGKSKMIQNKRLGQFSRRLGWIPALEPYINKYQQGGGVGFEKKSVRHQIHKRLGAMKRRDVEVSPSAKQPARPFIPQIVKEEQKVFRKNIQSIVTKLINKK